MKPEGRARCSIPAHSSASQCRTSFAIACDNSTSRGDGIMKKTSLVIKRALSRWPRCSAQKSQSPIGD
jgi:hypothetical protein